MFADVSLVRRRRKIEKAACFSRGRLAAAITAAGNTNAASFRPELARPLGLSLEKQSIRAQLRSIKFRVYLHNSSSLGEPGQ